MSPPKNLVVLIGIDTFAAKNLHQLDVLNSEGFYFGVLTPDVKKRSQEILQQTRNPDRNHCVVLKSGFVSRLAQVFSYLWKNRRRIHHLEIYPGGKFSQFYLWLAKLLNLKTLIIERGDLVDLEHYPTLIRFSMKTCYRFSDRICYREPYMLPLLKPYGEKKLTFIHNAIPVPTENNTTYDKIYTFLWANRLMHQRYPDWIPDILNDPHFSGTRNAMLGFMKKEGIDARIWKKQEYVRAHRQENLEIHEMTDPTPFYLQSRFFLLPSDVVFCNFALIEAMGHGVVPIITESPGAELIVDDGVDGFLSAKNPEDYKKSMQRAVQLTPQEYEAMSRNAIQKIANQFSIGKWKKNMMELYQEIQKGTVSP